MAMLHEDWKSRTPIKQVMVVNTDAKKIHSIRYAYYWKTI